MKSLLSSPSFTSPTNQSVHPLYTHRKFSLLLYGSKIVAPHLKALLCTNFGLMRVVPMSPFQPQTLLLSLSVLWLDSTPWISVGTRRLQSSWTSGSFQLQLLILQWALLPLGVWSMILRTGCCYAWVLFCWKGGDWGGGIWVFWELLLFMTVWCRICLLDILFFFHFASS